MEGMQNKADQHNSDAEIQCVIFYRMLQEKN